MDLGSKGAVGCYLSHLHVWRLMRERALPYALVLEDDAHFSCNFTADVRTYIEQVRIRIRLVASPATIVFVSGGGDIRFPTFSLGPLVASGRIRHGVHHT